MQNKIIHVFTNADLRCGHDGLRRLAKSKANLKKGEHAVFINSARDKMKILSHGDLLSYKRSVRGKLDLETVRHIPDAFGVQGGFSYRKALEKVLKEKVKH